MARQKDKDKPGQIIDAAFAVFGDVGYEATVIKDIADRAGVSSGTIYTYFKDKKDLFRATAQEGWNRFLAQIRELGESKEPAELRVQKLLDIGFGNLKTSLPLLRGMLFESSQMNILQQSLTQLCELLEKTFAERPKRWKHASDDPQERRSLIRLTVIGVFFTAALADPSRVDSEIETLRRTITLQVMGE